MTPNSTVWSFTATDAANALATTTIINFEVVNAAAAKFVINVPTNITAGLPFLAKVSVLDAYGNRVKNYFGTVHFTDAAAATGLPADYTFNGDDAGDHSFTVTLNTIGTQTLTVVDTSNSLLSVSTSLSVKAPSTGGGGSGGGGSGSGGGGSGGGGKKVVGSRAQTTVTSRAHRFLEIATRKMHFPSPVISGSNNRRQRSREIVCKLRRVQLT